MTRICVHADCDRGGKLTRGLCAKHYRAWLDHTPPHERGPAPRFARTFEQYVEKSDAPDGCWLWTGPTNRKGYGFWSLGAERGLAHRVALTRSSPPPSPGLMACHHCDTPACVRPSHLYWGTAADNARDASERGQVYRPPLSLVCPQGHPKEGDNLVVYNGQRFCRSCTNARAREYQRRKRQEARRESF